MLKLYEDKSLNLADIVLFLLLFCANGWASMNFPQKIAWGTSHEFEGFTGAGALAILIGSIPGVLCFFYHSRGSNIEAQTWVGQFSKLIEFAGIIVMSFTVSVMAILTLVLLLLILAPNKGFETSMVMIITFGFLSVFILPFVLIKKYIRDRPNNEREINPTLRYFMLIPAIFLTSALLNSNALGIFPDVEEGTVKGWFISAGTKIFDYIFFFSAPRMFATGRPIELKNSANWAIGSVLYFAGLSY